MAEIAARLTRPIRRLSRTATVALVLALLVTAAGAALFARAYTLRDSVLPGVSVAEVDVGGLARIDAQARLRQELAPRLAEPVHVTVGDKAFAVQPDRVWTLDLPATEQRAFQAGRESLASRLGALVGPFASERSVEPVLDLRPGERREMRARLRELTARPVDASLSVEGARVVVCPGQPGTDVEVEPLLVSVQTAALAGSQTVAAQIRSVAPAITTEDAEAVAAEARAILAGPIAIRFRGKSVGELLPRRVAEAMSFARAGGTYEITLDPKSVEQALLPMVTTRLREPVDATFRVVGQRVRVVPGRPGTTLDAERATRAVLAAGRGPGRRVAVLGLTALAADFSTKEAKALGIREQISTFTTDMGESSANRIWNVHLIGDYMDGELIRS